MKRTLTSGLAEVRGTDQEVQTMFMISHGNHPVCAS
jgi:hypothetical protein